ncbi:hypothetical protein SAMN05421788_107168 [Filimonas lacunae]|uniref:Uncharacterized protein n=1 Tax=Filimonas lacunae TaxID=477680 RepID=A0A173MFV0_9BACT|nr:hypothetical protein FLA_2523 [Filimonas lacunae]SIT27201.1 hypothetical protein SAMN05421788_107168 [Filimonas lacunae]
MCALQLNRQIAKLHFPLFKGLGNAGGNCVKNNLSDCI